MDLGVTLYMTPKAQATKERIDKLNFIKIKVFCASKKYYEQSKKATPQCQRKYLQIKYLIRD